MGEGEHEHSPIVIDANPQPLEGEKGDIIAPLTDHAAKITRLEEHQAQQEERLARQLSELEERLANAHGEHARQLEEKISSLESRIEELKKPVEPVEVAANEAIPNEAVEINTPPPVEPSPAPPEKERKGIAHRRKARRHGKGK